MAHQTDRPSGACSPVKAVWDHIEEGAALGHIHDLFGQVIADVIAKHSGTIVSLLPIQHVPAGVSTGIIL
jgi:predicted deacylase